MQKIIGFHLIEILIVLSIISIFASITLPRYSQYVAHEKRLEAAGALTKLAVAMEQYQIENNTYENATLENLHFSSTVAKNAYRLYIQTATETDYLLVAAPNDKQAENDPECGALTLDAKGNRGVSGSGEIETCW